MRIFREMKVLAARSGSSVKEFIRRAIEREVPIAHFSVKLPLVPTKHPGALRSRTNAEIEDLLD